MLRSLTTLAAALVCFAGTAIADEITSYSFDNATVQAAGPRSGPAGKTYFNIEGPGQGNFRCFGVLDYATNGEGLAFAKPFEGDVGDIASMSIDLTEGFPAASWYATGTLNFYVVTDTASSIQPGNPNLVCLAGADQCGTQLGNKYLLGSGLYESSWGNGSERHNLALDTMDPAGKAVIIDALNTGSNFRIVVEGVGSVGAGLEGQYTFGGVYLAPMLHLDVVEAEEPSVVGDFTGDGVVDGSDLDYVLANWGGETGGDELDQVLGNWGFGTNP